MKIKLNPEEKQSYRCARWGSLGDSDYAFIMGQAYAYQLMGYKTKVYGFYTDKKNEAVDDIVINSFSDYQDLLNKSPMGTVYIELFNPNKNEKIVDGE